MLREDWTFNAFQCIIRAQKIHSNGAAEETENPRSKVAGFFYELCPPPAHSFKCKSRRDVTKANEVKRTGRKATGLARTLKTET